MPKNLETGGKCVVCKGDIVPVIIREHDPFTGPIIIGPGSANQMRERSDGFHCKTCGLKYAFVPPANIGK